MYFVIFLIFNKIFNFLLFFQFFFQLKTNLFSSENLMSRISICFLELSLTTEWTTATSF